MHRDQVSFGIRRVMICELLTTYYMVISGIAWSLLPTMNVLPKSYTHMVELMPTLAWGMVSLAGGIIGIVSILGLLPARLRSWHLMGSAAFWTTVTWLSFLSNPVGLAPWFYVSVAGLAIRAYLVRRYRWTS